MCMSLSFHYLSLKDAFFTLIGHLKKHISIGLNIFISITLQNFKNKRKITFVFSHWSKVMVPSELFDRVQSWGCIATSLSLCLIALMVTLNFWCT